MIVSDQHRFVYVALPHTASTSTREWLIRQYAGRKEGKDHDAYVPTGCEDYTFWTVARDPFDMACGMWRKFARTPDHNALWNYLEFEGIDPPKDFTDFARMLATEGLPHFPPKRRFVHRPPWWHTGGLGSRFDHVLDFDMMPDILTTLPFVESIESFPHRNRNGADLAGWETPDTPENRRLVQTWTEVNG